MAVATKIASVLRVFSQGRSDLSVTEVAQELGIPKSSASRLLKDMHDAGLLMRAGNSLRYRVGPLLFEAGRSYRANSTLIRVAGEHIAKLSARTGIPPTYRSWMGRTCCVSRCFRAATS